MQVTCACHSCCGLQAHLTFEMLHARKKSASFSAGTFEQCRPSMHVLSHRACRDPPYKSVYPCIGRPVSCNVFRPRMVTGQYAPENGQKGGQSASASRLVTEPHRRRTSMALTATGASVPMPNGQGNHSPQAGCQTPQIHSRLQ